MKETLVVHPDFAKKKAALQDVIHRFDSMGEFVVNGERNVIKKVTVAGAILNIKKFKTPNFFQGLVYQLLRKSKARRSFEYAQKLIDFDFKTPSPVAYFERTSFGLKESFYISQHLEYDFDFRKLNHNPKWPDRDEILRQFTSFTFHLHEHGVNFLDHSPGNTLIKQIAPGHYDFYLIDLNRMRFESMGFNKRMKNFRRMWLSKGMIDVMAPVYAVLYDRTTKDTRRLMTHYSRKFQKRVNAKKVRKRKKKG